MARRIVEVVELCEHGARNPHIVNLNRLQHEYECVPERRVLDPGEYVLVEKVDGEWPAIEIDGRSVLGPVMAQTLADILAEEGAL